MRSVDSKIPYIPTKQIGDIELTYQSINHVIETKNDIDNIDNNNNYIIEDSSQSSSSSCISSSIIDDNSNNGREFHPLPKSLRKYYTLFIYFMILLFCMIIVFTIIIDSVDGIRPDYVED